MIVNVGDLGHYRCVPYYTRDVGRELLTSFVDSTQMLWASFCFRWWWWRYYFEEENCQRLTAAREQRPWAASFCHNNNNGVPVPLLCSTLCIQSGTAGLPKESTDETTTIVFFGHRRTTTIIIILKQNQICALERRWNWQNAVESSLDFSKESNELYWPTVQGFRTWNSWETLNVLTGRDNRTGTAWNTVNPSHIDHM